MSDTELTRVGVATVQVQMPEDSLAEITSVLVVWSSMGHALAPGAHEFMDCALQYVGLPNLAHEISEARV